MLLRNRGCDKRRKGYHTKYTIGKGLAPGLHTCSLSQPPYVKDVRLTDSAMVLVDLPPSFVSSAGRMSCGRSRSQPWKCSKYIALLTLMDGERSRTQLMSLALALANNHSFVARRTCPTCTDTFISDYNLRSFISYIVKLKRLIRLV